MVSWLRGLPLAQAIKCQLSIRDVDILIDGEQNGSVLLPPLWIIKYTQIEFSSVHFSLKVRGFINCRASSIDPIVSDNLWLDTRLSLLQTLFKIWP